jgi:FtsH-binding integral membrane protein
VNELFPTLLAKTFFIVSAQLFITWLTTHFVFRLFKRIDPKLDQENPYAAKKVRPSKPPISSSYTDAHTDEGIWDQLVEDTDPRYSWVFSSFVFYSILAFSSGLFLLLLFWGIDQPLAVSFSLFSAWSFLMGIQLEYVLLNIAEGLGRKVLALTSIIVLAAAVIGMYSDVDFGFLQLPLFIALSIFLAFSLFNVFRSMGGLKQRVMSAFGVVIFTLYLVFDFNSLLKKENIGDNTWPDAMHLAIKIYLDIINLILQLLKLLSRHHH